MSYRRLAVAAALFLAAAYLKLCLPSFEAAVLPALQAALAEEQRIVLPEREAAWLIWG